MTTPNNISAFIHCRMCLDELPGDQSPRDYARFDVGFTPKGIQIWCSRHEINVADVDVVSSDKPTVNTSP